MEVIGSEEVILTHLNHLIQQNKSDTHHLGSIATAEWKYGRVSNRKAS
ncbi:hypothetical protein A5844_000307 [Enterococcus sp. 10A9_DIV0425]|uniref:Uncharacterized protein n=1 Tax=Candidatus Enterococcus wittei TaxID=1987383 RepID=A0A2C9XPJ8_9ENTE|nr:hypothetical protein A5844_000307 [Enterococcus sp. 10A9_DIV0425]